MLNASWTTSALESSEAKEHTWKMNPYPSNLSKGMQSSLTQADCRVAAGEQRLCPVSAPDHCKQRDVQSQPCSDTQQHDRAAWTGTTSERSLDGKFKKSTE